MGQQNRPVETSDGPLWRVDETQRHVGIPLPNDPLPNGAPNRLRHGDGPFREIVETVPAAIYTIDAAGRITFYNDAAAALWGCRPELGKSEFCGSWKLFYPDGRPMRHDECPMALALKQKRPIRDTEAIAERPDGTRVSFIPYPTPLFDASGTLVGAVNMLVDITERKQAEEARELLLRETQHRVKNSLAMAQAIAAQTFRAAPDEQRKSFASRLRAFTDAHDLLTDQNWDRALLLDVVRRALEPFGGDTSGRFTVAGSNVLLPASKALLLAMALHELATNAAKYGSLSNEIGQVHVTWDIAKQGEEHRLTLQWLENGGPPVAIPERKGFGTLLLDRTFAEPDVATVEFSCSGVICVIEMSL